MATNPFSGFNPNKSNPHQNDAAAFQKGAQNPAGHPPQNPGTHNWRGDGFMSHGSMHKSTGSSQTGTGGSLNTDFGPEPYTTSSTASDVQSLVNSTGTNTDTGTGTNTTVSANAPVNTNAASGTSLYPSGTPTVDDVNQGQISDCSLDAQLASLAQNNPSAIQNMITNNPAGGYDVTLYPNGQKTTEHVTQSDMDAIKGTTGANKSDNWASVIEAATIKSGQSYASGSDPGKIMQLLTGDAGTDMPTSSLNGSTSQLEAALSAGKLVSAMTSNASGDIVADHDYSVLSISNGMVTVRNPWGNGGANGGAAANNGLETMSVSQFLSSFDNVQVQN